MSFVWRYLDQESVSCGRSVPFDDRDEAEAWLAERWPKIVRTGIATVELMEGDEALYRMSLREE